jgi:drug/metabolite transporter (DMT)-like permease
VPEPPLKVAFYRSAFAAVALFLYFRPRRVPRSGPILVAIAAYAGCLTTFVVATKWTTAANAIFLQFTGVVWVLLAAPILLGEPRRRGDTAAVVAALAGMSLCFAGKLEGRSLAGDAMALLSSFLFAFLVISLRRERGSGAEAVVTFGNLLAAAVVFPFVASNLSVDARSLAWLAFLGVFQLASAYVLFVAGIRSVPAAKAALIGLLEPVANPIWVFLAIGEKPGSLAVAGGAIVLAAVAWRTLAAGPPAAEAAPPD